MSFLTPIAGLIAAGIAIPALVALYFLKLRRRQVVVSSTFLWKRAIHDMQVNAPFQKLRRNLLLLLQLLALAAMLMAFARPALPGKPISGNRLIILIDHSASMNATDVAPTRLAKAKQLALQKLGDFAGSGGAMVISFAQSARVVQSFTTDKGLLRQAIQSIRPTDERTELNPALRLVAPYAAQAATGVKGRTTLSILVFTDGRTQDAEPGALRGGQVSFIRLGSMSPTHWADNLAIVSLAARRDLSKPTHVQVFARLANFGPRETHADLTLSVEGTTVAVRPIAVPPAKAPSPTDPDKLPEPGSQSVEFSLDLPGAALVTLSHDHHDALAADNTARLYIAPPRLLQVLLVTHGNAFLQRVLEAQNVRQVTTWTPAQFEAAAPATLPRGATGDPNAGYDVIVFDHYSPKYVPPVNSLYWNAAPPIKGLRIVPEAADEPKTQVVLDWRRDDPIMRYVTMDDVLISQPGRLVLPDTATVLATGQSGPIIAEVTQDNVRHVVASFDILQTNWPMQVSFVVFMGNVIHTLALGGDSGALSYAPGDVVVVPAPDGTLVRYDGPTTLEARAEQGKAVLPMFKLVGLYRADFTPAPAPPWDRLAVNLCDARESDLRPANKLAVSTTGSTAATIPVNVRQEIWPWFLWAALALLLVEWLVYTRRMHM